MVVLRSGGASYWVVNTLLDSLSNETMLSIARAQAAESLGAAGEIGPVKIGIFGAGWVGLVTGACFADLGHEVVIRDIVAERIESLRAGRVPFHEPGVEELLARNEERLTFTTEVSDSPRRRRCSSASARRRPTPATPTCPPSGTSSTSCRSPTSGRCS